MRMVFLFLSLCLVAAQPAAAAAVVQQEPADSGASSRLTNLFHSLAGAEDSPETLAIARKIEQLWLQQPSPTSDLLMQRALVAMNQQQYDVALNLLNALIRTTPDWAEAWNKRATVRYLLDDELGSLSDIERVLELEPRHFGALSGEAMILEHLQKKSEALQVYRQILNLAPQWPNVKTRVDHLTIEVEGQGI